MATRRFASGESGAITRRALIAGAATAGAVSLVRPGTGLAAGALASQPVFAASVGGLIGESRAIHPGRRFIVAGIEWTEPAKATIELRAQATDGQWSPWVTASTLGHDSDGGAAPQALYGEPLWTGPAIAVQLRSNRHVSGLRVHFVTGRVPSRGATAAALPLATPVLDAGPGQPPIIARQAWAGGAARPAHVPDYGSVKLGFVHHTVNPNGYSAAAVPSMLRGIFDYHVHVRGWWDIGYNFVIDAYGRIWEARAGGIDMPVVGAQAGGYNTESTGVSMLGDFTSVTPSPAAVRSLEHLLAWKLSLHGLPTTGRVTVVVDPTDAFYTPYRGGTHVSLPRVAGHRDGDLTDCPGNALYGELPAIRGRITALAGTAARATIAPPSPLITPGASVELTGALLLLSGQPLSGATLQLEALLADVPPATALGTVTTAADGSWSQALTFQENTLVRAVHADSPASVSDWARVSVAPVVNLSVQSTSPLILSGSVSPAKKYVTVSVYRAGATNRKPISHKRVKTSFGGGFTAQLRAHAPGSYVVIARTSADARNAAGASAPVAVSVG